MSKVLIIEDEPLVARMYEKTLSFSKFQTVTAIGGKEGLEKAFSEAPDVILLDIMMPEPDGMEVLAKLKADSKTINIPVIVLTNLSGRFDNELALSKGAVAYWVKKDAKPENIGAKIREILEKSESKATSQA